jgi:hypothetical protein
MSTSLGISTMGTYASFTTFALGFPFILLEEAIALVGYWLG